MNVRLSTVLLAVVVVIVAVKLYQAYGPIGGVTRAGRQTALRARPRQDAI